jgi:uncharacterized protein YodC (DUF2158 family)
VGTITQEEEREMAKLEIGSVVQLISGGPKMTISKIYIPGGSTTNTEFAECQWFEKDTKPMKEKFPTKSLKIVSAEDEGPIEPQF